MSKLAMIDSQIFIWGIKGFDSPGQDHAVRKARGLVKWLEDNDFKLLFPVPQLVELLSFVPPSKQPEIRALIDKRFQVVPFDDLAASKCAELIHNILSVQDLRDYRDLHVISKHKLKFDCMLVATAIVRGASRIYTHDKDVKRFAQGQIDVKMLEELPDYLQQTAIEFPEGIRDREKDRLLINRTLGEDEPR